MDSKERIQIELQCLNDMFSGKLDEDVVYIVYDENSGQIDKTLEQLLHISSSSFTGYLFDTTDVLTASNKRLSPTTPSTYQNNKGETQAKVCNSKARDEKWMTIKSKKERKNGNSSKSDSPQPTTPDFADQTTQNKQPEAYENVETDVQSKIEKLKQDIANILEEKKNTQSKATYYHGKKMFPVSGFYSDLGRQLDKRIEALSNDLVDHKMKQCENSSSLDLHGLNLNQSCSLVRRLLEDRKQRLIIDKQGTICFDIITGWGKNSVNHGRIRASILNILRDQGLIYYHINKGAVRVTITRGSM